MWACPYVTANAIYMMFKSPQFGSLLFRDFGHGDRATPMLTKKTLAGETLHVYDDRKV